MIVECPPPPEFQIFRKNILHFMKRVKICCSNRSRDVYPLNQGYMSQLLSFTLTQLPYFRPRHTIGANMSCFQKDA